MPLCSHTQAGFSARMSSRCCSRGGGGAGNKGRCRRRRALLHVLANALAAAGTGRAAASGPSTRAAAACGRDAQPVASAAHGPSATMLSPPAVCPSSPAPHTGDASTSLPPARPASLKHVAPTGRLHAPTARLACGKSCGRRNTSRMSTCPCTARRSRTTGCPKICFTSG
jgi:hypothetical protein